MRRTLIAALLCAAVPSAAHASDAAFPNALAAYPATRAEIRLVELVAKVSFNEGLDSYHDLALIWQVVEGHGATARERYRWLAAHSPCVSGRLSQEQAYQRPGNCAWSRNLRPDDRLPRGWTAASGVWHRTTSRRWLAHLPRVRDLVLGLDPYRPCAETPQTWDGVRYGEAVVGADGRRILRCAEPYTAEPGEPGLHNFAVRYDGASD